MGTLRHGVPLVLLPLFSHDQWENAAAVQRIGAGIALDAERGARRATALPDARSLHALAGAVRTVLTDRRYRDAAESVAAAARALPPVSESAKVLESLVDRVARGR